MLKSGFFYAAFVSLWLTRSIISVLVNSKNILRLRPFTLRLILNQMRQNYWVRRIDMRLEAQLFFYNTFLTLTALLVILIVCCCVFRRNVELFALIYVFLSFFCLFTVMKLEFVFFMNCKKYNCVIGSLTVHFVWVTVLIGNTVLSRKLEYGVFVGTCCYVSYLSVSLQQVIVKLAYALNFYDPLLDFVPDPLFWDKIRRKLLSYNLQLYQRVTVAIEEHSRQPLYLDQA
ncbi:Hypothetical_protein [Hexamita inflata]|uniref:Hypothetical_protein n=1 Tax=Hexamita inflata TaxID=28002 RepID=A0AA86QPR9_9EUKA|nr:Hypothetical protein HINF_LOCUS47126 [Hexamita inflata]